MKKNLKMIIPAVAVLLIAVLGGAIYASSSSSKLNVKMADGTGAANGIFSMSKGQSVDFNVFKGNTEIAVGDAAYTVVWESSDMEILWVDAATGAATADKNGLMPVTNGEVTLTVSVTENSSGNVMKRSYSVKVGAGSLELVTTISGINDGLALELGNEYTLLSRTYNRSGNNFSMASNQLFCAYECSTLTISGGKFVAAERGTHRIITIGYATEADMAAGINEVTRDVLEVFVYTDATPTPTSTPTVTPEPTATPVPTETPAPTPTEAPAVTPEPTPTEEPAVTPEPTPTEAPAVTPEPTPTEVPAVTPEPTPTEVPGVTPDITPTETPAPTVIPTPEPTVVPAPTEVPAPTATVAPTPTQSADDPVITD